MEAQDLVKKPSKIRLGTEDVVLDYTMASIYYLTEKYGDIGKLFSREGGSISKEYIERIADVVYAGLLRYDDEGKDVSGWTPKRVMSGLHFDQLKDVIGAFTAGITAALPKASADPTVAEEKDPPTAGDGTGDISTPPRA